MRRKSCQCSRLRKTEKATQGKRARPAKRWREWLSAWDDYHAEADEYRALDDERVLVLGRMSGRGRISGAIVETETVSLFHTHEGKVTRLVLYSSRQRAFADLGLAPEANASGS